MKILIDISQIVYGTGVSVYTRNLVESLLNIDKENDYTLFGGTLRRREEIQLFFKQLNKYDFDGRIAPIPPSLANILWNRLHVIKIENFYGNNSFVIYIYQKLNFIVLCGHDNTVSCDLYFCNICWFDKPCIIK